MIRTILEDSKAPFTWLDVSDPAKNELNDLATRYGFDPVHVQQCLDPNHLPKFEKTGDTVFMILRVYDETKESKKTLRGLTRKLAVFQKDGLLLTIHRKEFPLIDEIAAKGTSGLAPKGILTELISRVLATYRPPLEEIEHVIDGAEAALFSRSTGSQRVLKRVHTQKRRVTVIKRMMLHTSDALQQLNESHGRTLAVHRHLRDNAQSIYLLADELLDDLNSLIATHLALASHHTNEVVRILTLFSVFFMPLTFIVGVYGMNFVHLPELKWRYGYAASWVLMIVVTVGIWRWFYQRGWLR